MWRIAFLLLLILMFPSSVSAHLAGQPPFFKINGKFTTIYPIQASPYTKAFTFPQDIPVEETFFVGKSIDFTLEEKFLPFPADYLPHLTFLWDFGDHQTGSGLANTHTYTKPGSYEIVVKTLTDEDAAEPQLLQSTFLSVLPTENYIVPKPVITVNGKDAKEYSLGFIETNFQDEQVLSVKFAKKPSGKIVGYEWDLDDDTTAKGLSVTHRYAKNRSFTTPILRVVDSNGIRTDISEIIVNKAAKKTPGTPTNFLLKNKTLLLSMSGVFLLILGVYFFRKKRNKKT